MCFSKLASEVCNTRLNLCGRVFEPFVLFFEVLEVGKQRDIIAALLVVVRKDLVGCVRPDAIEYVVLAYGLDLDHLPALNQIDQLYEIVRELELLLPRVSYLYGKKPPHVAVML